VNRPSGFGLREIPDGTTIGLRDVAGRADVAAWMLPAVAKGTNVRGDVIASMQAVRGTLDARPGGAGFRRVRSRRPPMSFPPDAPPLVILSFNKCIVAVNARTGQHVWQHQVGESFEIVLRADEQRVFCAAAGVLACLSYLDGSELWSVQLPGNMAGYPNMLLHAGCVILMSCGEALAFDMCDGSRLWQDKFKGYGTAGGAMAAPGVASPVDRIR
jgi:outer membrane protein assembly factor BamB